MEHDPFSLVFQQETHRHIEPDTYFHCASVFHWRFSTFERHRGCCFRTSRQLLTQGFSNLGYMLSTAKIFKEHLGKFSGIEELHGIILTLWFSSEYILKYSFLRRSSKMNLRWKDHLISFEMNYKKVFCTNLHDTKSKLCCVRVCVCVCTYRISFAHIQIYPG